MTNPVYVVSKTHRAHAVKSSSSEEVQLSTRSYPSWEGRSLLPIKWQGKGPLFSIRLTIPQTSALVTRIQSSSINSADSLADGQSGSSVGAPSRAHSYLPRHGRPGTLALKPVTLSRREATSAICQASYVASLDNKPTRLTVLTSS